MAEWLVKHGNTNIQDILIRDKNGDKCENLADAESIIFQVKEKITDETAVIEKTKGNGISVLTGEDLGKLRITILPSDTINLECKSYIMGCQIRWDADTIYEINLTVNRKLAEIFRIIQDVL